MRFIPTVWAVYTTSGFPFAAFSYLTDAQEFAKTLRVPSRVERVCALDAAMGNASASIQAWFEELNRASGEVQSAAAPEPRAKSIRFTEIEDEAGGTANTLMGQIETEHRGWFDELNETSEKAQSAATPEPQATSIRFTEIEDEDTRAANTMMQRLQAELDIINGDVVEADILPDEEEERSMNDYIIDSQRPVLLYTDGACSGNPGPAGSGWAVIQIDGGERLLAENSIPLGIGTNNIAELTAAIAGLNSLPTGLTINLYTDSEYVQKGITSWIDGWKKRGWKTADKKPVKNVDLWKDLDAAVERHGRDNVTILWTKGHSGKSDLNDRWNDYVDQLACRARDASKS